MGRPKGESAPDPFSPGQLGNQFFDPQDDEDPNRRKIWEEMIKKTREEMKRIADFIQEVYERMLYDGPHPPSVN